MKKIPKKVRSASIIIVVLGIVLIFLGEKNLAYFDSKDSHGVVLLKSLLPIVERGSEQPLHYDSHLGFNSNTDKQIGPKNFSEAKKVAKQLYLEHRQTFYCGCHFDKYGKIDLKSCGYKIQQDLRRARRLEWEHIVPVSHIAAHLPCWQQKICKKENGQLYKGRECCREQDTAFAKMEADLHNLVPEIGELNACRSNFRFGMLPHIRADQFGECYFKIDKEIRRVEPRVTVRGSIARCYLYVADRYGMRLSDSQLQLFKAWNKEFPPDAWELERDQRIARIQGNHNPYISDYNQYVDGGL